MTDHLRELLGAATAVPWKVKPVDGKPTIMSDRGGNLFRGYIATWQEADLVVALRNSADTILTQLEALQKERDEARALVAELAGALEPIVGEELGGDASPPRNDYESYRTQISWHDRAIARAALVRARATLKEQSDVG